MACRGDQRRVERLGPGSDRVVVLLLTHPGDQLVKAHGAGEVVALEYIAAVAPEQFELFAVLHALGHHCHAQLAGGGDDAAADGGVLAVGDDTVDEAAVDLDALHRQVLEIAEAGIAGTEVVDAGSDAHPLEGVQGLDGGVAVAHEDALGELELQRAGGQGSAIVNILQGGKESRTVELQGRQVDGYPMVEQAQVQQLSGIPAGLGNDPVTQVHDLPGFLGNGDEPDRRDEALAQITPAYQSLQSAKSAALVHLGLIVEEQLVIAQRLLQLVAQGYPGGQLLVQIAGKDHIGIATLLLNLVHRHIRLLQHSRRRIQILGQEADADTGGDVQLVAADPVRLADLVENAISDQLGLPFGFQVRQQQDEFIAAETRQGIGGADRAVEAAGHVDKNLITDTVPEGIVDGLETIQVDEHDCQLLAAAPGQLDIVFQVVLQQGAVGQAG